MPASTSLRRRTASIAVILLLGTGGAVATASSAVAADADVFTPGWVWNAVDDRASYIDDARSYFEGYLGTTVNPYGFTSDAFDGFLSTSLTISDGVNSIPLLAGDWTAVPGTWTDFGLSTFEAEAVANFGDGNIVTVTRTLQIEGSYARWSWETVNAGAQPESLYTLTAIGTLGSGALTEKAGSSEIFVTYETAGFDPVIGHRYLGVGPFSVDVVDGQVEFRFNGDGGRLDLALLEFDPCSRQAAVDTMLDLLPTLATDFGTVLDPVYSDDCLFVEELAPISGAADELLPLVENTGLDSWDFVTPTSLADGLSLEVLDAPAGLAFALEIDPDSGEPALRMTGTPAESGDVRLLLYFDDGAGTQEYPLVVSFEVVVALAATGSALPATAILAGGLLVFGGTALLLLVRRGAARAH